MIVSCEDMVRMLCNGGGARDKPWFISGSSLGYQCSSGEPSEIGYERRTSYTKRTVAWGLTYLTEHSVSYASNENVESDADFCRHDT